MPDNQNDPEYFYKKVISLLQKHKIPFMVGGGVAVETYTFIDRPMKDLDLFVKAGDYPKILNLLKEDGIITKILDDRWLAQAKQGKLHVDFIFSSPNYMNVVNDRWFDRAHNGHVLGISVKVVAPEELLWCKIYIQDRTHFEGADVNHLVLSQGKHLDWNRLLTHFENHWELLLGAVINFRFVYPSDRFVIPNWLICELISRLQNQLTNPVPIDKVCRGPLISRTQYKVDINEEGYLGIT